MGNCFRRYSSMVWAGDELEPMEAAASQQDGGGRGIADTAEKGGALPRPLSGREVKIKITKKELEQLLAKVDTQGATLEHVLAQLMNNGTDTDRPADMQRQRSWRPALQSIPEVN